MPGSSIVIVGFIIRTIDHLAIITAAMLLIYIGYRILLTTVQADSGFEASTPWGKLKITKAAPGMLLGLFGCVVLVVALTRPLKLRIEIPQSDGPGSGARPAAVAPIKIETELGVGGVQQSRAINFEQCAKSLNVALGALTLAITQSTVDAQKRRYDSAHEGVEDIVGFCVDQTVGAGAYGRYKRVQAAQENGGGSEFNDASKSAYEKVSRLLGD